MKSIVKYGIYKDSEIGDRCLYKGGFSNIYDAKSYMYSLKDIPGWHWSIDIVTQIYHNEAINKMRVTLEEEFRKQYDITCHNEGEWSRKFKVAFENVCEAFYNLDILIK